MTMTGTVRLRGEGGVIHTFDLPLHPAYAKQVALGKLLPAGPTDEALLQVIGVQPDPEPAAAPVAAEGDPVAAPTPEPPTRNASTEQWQEFAAARGLDNADEFSRDELVAWWDDQQGGADG